MNYKYVIRAPLFRSIKIFIFQFQLTSRDGIDGRSGKTQKLQASQAEIKSILQPKQRQTIISGLYKMVSDWHINLLLLSDQHAFTIEYYFFACKNPRLPNCHHFWIDGSLNKLGLDILNNRLIVTNCSHLEATRTA